jgi:hypothetical protein
MRERILEWEPNERDAWVADAQRWICQIKGVLQCKIELDPEGEISGVHVVAGLEREPRHIVRDVESLLKARLQMDVYYKKIGVVQVMGNSGSASNGPSHPSLAETDANGVPGSAGVSFHPPGSGDDSLGDLEWEERSDAAVGTLAPPEGDPAPADVCRDEAQPAVLVAEGLTPRITCGGVGVMASDMVVRAEVQLRAGGVEARGTLEGPNHADSDIHLVAKATLEAVSELLTEPVLLHLKEVRVGHLGGQDLILTAVDLVEGRISDTLFGTCSTRHNRHQAVVHAVLDALNRRLSMYSLKNGTDDS